MIKEDYVSFEIARFLEEKGFLENTPMVYTQNGCFIPNGVLEDAYQKLYPAPTLQMAMKWLREIKGIIIEVLVGEINQKTIDNNIILFNTYKTIVCFPDENGLISKFSASVQVYNLNTERDSFDTYEDACEAAMKYCLEKLI